MFRALFLAAVLMIVSPWCCQNSSTENCDRVRFVRTHVVYDHDLHIFGAITDEDVYARRPVPADVRIAVVDHDTFAAYQLHSNLFRYANADELLALNEQHPEMLTNLNRVCAKGTKFILVSEHGEYTRIHTYPQLSRGPSGTAQGSSNVTRYGYGRNCYWYAIVQNQPHS